MQQPGIEAENEGSGLPNLQVPSAALQEAPEGGFHLGTGKPGVGYDIPYGDAALRLL